MGNFLKNLALLFVTLFLIFGIGEVFARFFLPPPMQVVKEFSAAETQLGTQNLISQGMPDTLYQYSEQGGVRLTPNAKITIAHHYLSNRSVEISTNSLGFRAPELSRKRPEERRILVLGDSITLGDYVNADETYPSRLEDHLKRRGESVQVVNAGIGSADIRNEYKILTESGFKVEPDMVLVGLYLNDGELSVNLAAPPLPGMIKKSYLASYLNRQITVLLYRWKHRQELHGSDKVWIEKFIAGRELKKKPWLDDKEGFDFLIVNNARDWGAAWFPNSWKTIEEYLLKMRDMAERQHFKLGVVLFPVRYQIEAKYLYDNPQQSFKDLMEKLKLPHLDLLPPLRQAWNANPNQLLYYDKCHLTPEGNDIVGKAIAGFITQ
jgi:lysophospholipase L1-like esterase